jgi:hypothetical protein
LRVFKHDLGTGSAGSIRRDRKIPGIEPELDLENHPLETKLRPMAATLHTLHADGRIVFSFPEEALPLSEQVSFVAFVKADWAARQSRFTQQDADRLADEVDASWWSNNKQRILSQIAAA